MEQVQAFYRKNINNPDFQDYMKQRNINPGLIDYFKLGYAPSYKESESFIEAVEDKAHISEVLNQYNGPLFYERLTIPLYDDEGNLLGYSARTIKDSQIKYINSPTTERFVKGEFLYNLNNAKQRLENENYVYMVEGPLDVFAFKEAAWERPVVATMGTALTDEQVALLNKHQTKKVVLAYDGDNAGFNANIKNGLKLLNSGIDVTVVSFDKDDPFDLLNKSGKEVFVNTINHEESLPAYFLQSKMLDIVNQQDYEKQKQAIINSVDFIDIYTVATKDKGQYNDFLEIVSSCSGFKLETLLSTSNYKDEPIREVVNETVKQEQAKKEVVQVKSDNKPKEREDKSMSHIYITSFKALNDKRSIATIKYNDLIINGIHINVGENGVPFVSFPNQKGKDGKYYSIVKPTDYMNNVLTPALANLHGRFTTLKQYGIDEPFQTVQINIKENDFKKAIHNIREGENTQYMSIQYGQLYINNCSLRNGENGQFISLPSYQHNGEWQKQVVPVRDSKVMDDYIELFEKTQVKTKERDPFDIEIPGDLPRQSLTQRINMEEDYEKEI